MKCIVITGKPGAGKSTLARHIAERLKKRGLRVCGISCPDVRVNGKRVSFKVVDVNTGEGVWLARIEGCDGPRVGRYRVCKEAEEFSVKTLRKAMECDVVLIDEIGPMELKLPRLREEMLRIIKSGKPFVAVVHLRLKEPEFLEHLKRCSWIVVEKERREEARAKAEEILSDFP